jgi:hypothetical protein
MRDAAQKRRFVTKDRWPGWIALTVAVISLFAWPVILGPLAVLAGIAAAASGSRMLGVCSAVLGMISIVILLAIAPMYT